LCLVVGGDKEGKGKFWSSWFKPFRMGHCINWWKRLSSWEYCLYFQDL